MDSPRSQASCVKHMEAGGFWAKGKWHGTLLSRIKVSFCSKHCNQILRFWASKWRSSHCIGWLNIAKDGQFSQQTKPTHLPSRQYWFQLSWKQLCKTIKGVQLSHLKFQVWSIYTQACWLIKSLGQITQAFCAYIKLRLWEAEFKIYVHHTWIVFCKRDQKEYLQF